MERYEHLAPPESTEALLTRLMAPQPEVVAVSGGPCAGKTTLLEQLPAAAAQLGREVVVMPEVATQLIESGVDFGWLAAHDRQGYMDAQRTIIQTELNFITAAKEHFAGTNALIVLDRGVNDTFGYMTEREAAELAAEHGTTPHALGYDVTDKVVYLPSVAVGNPAAYEQLKATNLSRYEAAHEAAATCARTLKQWSQHPELHIIDAADFNEKIRRGLQFCLSGEQEYEQKWQANPAEAQSLIAAKTERGEMLSATHILQQYGEYAGLPFRLRRGLTSEGYEFFHFAIKQKTPQGNREVRRTITPEEYQQLAGYAPYVLRKTRYAFIHDGQVWQADILQHSVAGEEMWLFEAEVAHPDDIAGLKLPIPLTKSTASNQDFAIMMA